MSVRKLPVRPDLAQLRHQAKDLLAAIRCGDPDAIADLREYGPRVDPSSAKLSDAQHVLARSYQASSWPRLVHACELIDAIWRDDVDAVMALVIAHPTLLHEHATIRDSNWGPPMTYAANLGRDRIIRMLHKLGARDTEWALGRAVLQGKIDTAAPPVRGGPRRRPAARLPRRDATRLGRSVPPEGFRQPRIRATDRGAGWPTLARNSGCSERKEHLPRALRHSHTLGRPPAARFAGETPYWTVTEVRGARIRCFTFEYDHWIGWQVLL